MQPSAPDDGLGRRRAPKRIQQELRSKTDFSDNRSAAQQEVLKGCEVQHAQMLREILRGFKMTLETGQVLRAEAGGSFRLHPHCSLLPSLNSSLFANKVRDHGRHAGVETDDAEHAAVVRISECVQLSARFISFGTADKLVGMGLVFSRDNPCPSARRKSLVHGFEGLRGIAQTELSQLAP